jgi:hypothetical protein
VVKVFITVGKAINENGSVSFHLENLEGTKYFKFLLNILQKVKKVTVIKKVDMYTDMIAFLVLDQKEFMFQYVDFYGICFCTKNPQDSDFLEELANWLVEFLNDKIRKKMKQ